MCGIVGYVGTNQAAPILLDGLSKLEYRGYDSAGVCVFDQGILKVAKAKGRLQALADLIDGGKAIHGMVGIGHTRWATHGAPSDTNSHPHMADSGKIAVVHNGIIENYLELKELLISRGKKFQSETDTEVVANLIEFYSLEREPPAMQVVLFLTNRKRKCCSGGTSVFLQFLHSIGPFFRIIRKQRRNVMKNQTRFLCLFAVGLIIISLCAIWSFNETLVPSSETIFYGTVTDRAMAKVHEEDRSSRPYISIETDDGTTYLFWFSRTYTRKDTIHTLIYDGIGITNAKIGDFVRIEAAVEAQTELLVATKIQTLTNP